MARRQVPLQVNKFSKGLNTESNPLDQAPDISLNELNMDLDADGSRFKRLGFDYEENEVKVSTSIFVQADKNLVNTVYKWENAGNDPEKSLLVVQIGNYLGIHDLDDEVSISNGLIYSETFSIDTYDVTFSFTSVDGILVVVNGEKEVILYEYDSGAISKSTDTLLVRDLFGVESGTLTDQDKLDVRPTSLSGTHTYNLRNQTFYSPRYANEVEVNVDPIDAFFVDSGNSFYPANADNLNYFLYANPNDSGNRLIERFFSENMVVAAPIVGDSPRGHFIIDALERGESREAKELELRNTYPALLYAASNIPEDSTPGGATVIEEFAGRVWFSGFSGNVIGGDSKSPRMSSYVLFSSLVKDKTDISQCYQRADPTSNEDSALVDTDGGFIRISGAYGIKHMVNLEGSLFVFASNGVWRISGGDGSSFSATGYQVDKLGEENCIAPNSVVIIGSQIFFWGDRGIHNVSRNEFGIWLIKDLSTETIERFYSAIGEVEKRNCSGFFDQYQQKIHWVYTNPSEDTTNSNELILDTRYGAFTPFEVPVEAANTSIVVGVGENNPYKVNDVIEDVTVSGVTVEVGGVDVEVEYPFRITDSKESIYLVLSDISSTISYSFGFYQDDSFYDWGDVGYEAFLISGSITGGEARYKKQAPYLNTFFKKTENGFNTDLSPTKESSCLLSSQWNWTNNADSNKWSTPRQAYRIGRLYFPEDSSDDYDSGDTVISTRNKIRGIGHSVSFKFEAEEGKDLYIHGWSFDLAAAVKE